MVIGEFIKTKRCEAGLSQEKLGKLAGSKPETVMNIENCRTVPTDETIWHIGAALCFSSSEIDKCLENAQYYRNNRDALRLEHAIKSAERALKMRSRLY